MGCRSAGLNFLPTASPIPISNASQLTQTIEPTITPEPTSIQSEQLNEISPVFLSPEDQAAFILNGDLYVEDVNSDQFSNVSRQFENPILIRGASWSPTGDRIVFLYTPSEVINWSNVSLSDFADIGLWEQQTNAIYPLLNLIAGLDFGIERPGNDYNEPIQVDHVRWSPEGDRLLISSWYFGSWIVDLDPPDVIRSSVNRKVANIWWIDDSMFLLEDRQGMFCHNLELYLKEQDSWVQSDHFALGDRKYACNTSTMHQVSVDRQEIVNLHFPGAEKRRWVERIDLNSGEKTIIWELTDDLFALGFKPSVSPDGQYIAFDISQTYLERSVAIQVVDRDGRFLGEVENGHVINWRPGGGPILTQQINDKQSQLLYWTLDSTPLQTIMPRSELTFHSGSWRPDGQSFVFSAVDESIPASYLYLWRPENDVLELIFEFDSNKPFSNFTWRSNGKDVFFNIGTEKLLKFTLESRKTTDIRP